MLLIIATAFGLGALHVLAGPDHLAAVIGFIAHRLTRGFAAFRGLLLALSAAAIIVGVVWLIGVGGEEEGHPHVEPTETSSSHLLPGDLPAGSGIIG